LASSARLKKSIIRLLKEDEEFRYTVAGLIGLDEVLKRFDRYDDLFAKVLRRMEKHSEEIVKLRKEMVAGFRRHDELLAKHSEEITKLREDMVKGFAKHDELLAKHSEEITRLREDMVKGFAKHDELLAKHSEEITRLREDMVKGFAKHDEEIARLREDMSKGFARHDEMLLKHSEEIIRLREDMVAGFRRHDEEISKLREDMVKGFARHDELLARHSEVLAKHSEELVRLREDLMRGFELVEKRVSAVGARWGLMAEEAFREGLRGVLERDFGVRVERWRAFDDEGVVYGRPSDVEVDVAVSDGRVLLVEVSSHVRRSDISLFKCKAAFYERRCGRVPDRLVVVTPYADQDAVELAAALGIEVHTRV
jgi:hypothetical protein